MARAMPRPAAVAFWALAVHSVLVSAKPKKYGGHTAKVYWKKENECKKNECKHLHSDENDDCLAQCVSTDCYNEIYSSEPLEPGEIDTTRQNNFNKCVKR